MTKIFLALVAAACIACAATPAAEDLRAIAPGVSIAGNDVGGLTALPARDRLQAVVSRPITIRYRGASLTVPAQRLGVQASVDRAVEAALDARANAASGSASATRPPPSTRSAAASTVPPPRRASSAPAPTGP